MYEEDIISCPCLEQYKKPVIKHGYTRRHIKKLNTLMEEEVGTKVEPLLSKDVKCAVPPRKLPINDLVHTSIN